MAHIFYNVSPLTTLLNSQSRVEGRHNDLLENLRSVPYVSWPFSLLNLYSRFLIALVPYPSEKCGMVKLDGAIRSTLIRCSRSMLSDSQGGFVQSRHTLCLVGCLYRLANSFSLWEFRCWERRDRRPEHRLPLTFLLETSSSSSSSSHPLRPTANTTKTSAVSRAFSCFIVSKALFYYSRENMINPRNV